MTSHPDKVKRGNCKHKVNNGLIYWDSTNKCFVVDCTLCGKKLIALCNGEDIFVEDVGVMDA